MAFSRHSRRQLDDEPAAARVQLLIPYGAALFFRGKPAESETESPGLEIRRAPGLVGIGWLEERIALVLRHTRAGIAHHYLHRGRRAVDHDAHALIGFGVLQRIRHEVLDDPACEIRIAIAHH